MANVELVKEIYGVNTYTKAVDTSFTELVVPTTEATASVITVDQFFQYYDDLFFVVYNRTSYILLASFYQVNM